MELGNDEQKVRWLTPLAQVDTPMTSLAVTEPEVGSDSAAMTTKAVRVDGGYRISGQKTWISNGGAAEFYVVFAKTDLNERSTRCHCIHAQEGRRRAFVRSAHEEDGAARWSTPRCFSTRCLCQRPTGSAMRARASMG